MAYMESFFKKTHAPNNTVIAVVGDIQPQAVLKIIKKYFGHLSAKKLIPVPITNEPEQSGEKRVDVVFDAEPQMIMGYHKPPPPAFVDYAFDVMESILARGRTSRLFNALIEEKRLAKSIQAVNGLPGSRHPNQFVIFATPRHPHNLNELEKAIDLEIESLKREPVSDTELTKVKNKLRVDFIKGLNSNAGLAGMLSYYEALLGDFRYLTRYTDAIDRITPEDILYAARTYLSKENRTIAKLIRKSKT
jgi:predicted Zn-dependent peptidase